MIVVNRIGENISVQCRDKSWNVMHSDDKFASLMTISVESQEVESMDELNALIEKVDEICKDDYKNKVESFHKELYYQPVTQEYFIKLSDDVISVIPLPEQLVWRLETSIEKGISVDPIIKFWKRALRSHKAKDKNFMRRLAEYINMTWVDPAKKIELMEEQGLSEEIATEKATTFEVKITEPGLIACFKTSNEYLDKYEEDEDGNIVKVPRYKKTRKFCPDTGKIIEEVDERDTTKAEDRVFLPYIMGNGGDAFYCEGENGYAEPGHFIKIGCVHRLPDWSYVNCNDERSCVKGLHIGGLSYIAHWSGADIHTCLVDPMHIGAIPDYSGDKAIRVLQYYVDGSLVAVNHGIYHPSKYAEKTDAEWAQITAELKEAHGQSIAEYEEGMKQIENL